MSLLLAFVLVALAAGCGNSALKMNAGIARAMLEVQATSGPLIRELRVEAGVDAGRRAHDRGEPVEEAQAAARAAAGRWQCAIDGHRLFSLAVGTYIDALVIAQANDAFKFEDVIPFVRRALDTYRALSSCLRSLGSDALPAAPGFLNVIPPGWATTSTATEASP